METQLNWEFSLFLVIFSVDTMDCASQGHTYVNILKKHISTGNLKLQKKFHSVKMENFGEIWPWSSCNHYICNTKTKNI